MAFIEILRYILGGRDLATPTPLKAWPRPGNIAASQPTSTGAPSPTSSIYSLQLDFDRQFGLAPV